MKNKTLKKNSRKKNIKKAGSPKKPGSTKKTFIQRVNAFLKKNSNKSDNGSNSSMSVVFNPINKNDLLDKYIKEKNEQKAIEEIKKIKNWKDDELFNSFHEAVKNRMEQTVLWFIIKEHNVIKFPEKNFIIKFLDYYVETENKLKEEHEELGSFLESIKPIDDNKKFIYDTIEQYGKADANEIQEVLKNTETYILENIKTDTKPDGTLHPAELEKIRETIRILKKKNKK